eukprot:gene5738-7142_t
MRTTATGAVTGLEDHEMIAGVPAQRTNLTWGMQGALTLVVMEPARVKAVGP